MPAKPTNKNLTIHGRPHFDTPPGITTLHKDDSITVRMEGFQPGASVDGVTIYENIPGRKGHPGKKGNAICSWTRKGGNTCTMYAIAAQSDSQVRITDVDETDTAVTYWFGVSGRMGRGLRWTVDPELINRPGT